MKRLGVWRRCQGRYLFNLAFNDPFWGKETEANVKATLPPAPSIPVFAAEKK